MLRKLLLSTFGLVSSSFSSASLLVKIIPTVSDTTSTWEKDALPHLYTESGRMLKEKLLS